MSSSQKLSASTATSFLLNVSFLLANESAMSYIEKQRPLEKTFPKLHSGATNLCFRSDSVLESFTRIWNRGLSPVGAEMALEIAQINKITNF